MDAVFDVDARAEDLFVDLRRQDIDAVIEIFGNLRRMCFLLVTISFQTSTILLKCENEHSNANSFLVYQTKNWLKKPQRGHLGSWSSLHLDFGLF